VATLTATVLECPQCGTPVKQGSKTCDRCYSEYIITSVSGLKKFDDSGIKKYLKAYESSLKIGGESAELYTAMGICQLKRKMYSYALTYFEKAIALLPDEGDVYYYAAISVFNGKRPFMAQLSNVKKAVEYVDTALNFSEEGIYYYLKHLIHNDYYEKKHLNCSPSSSELLSLSRQYGLGENDAEDVRNFLSL